MVRTTLPVTVMAVLVLVRVNAQTDVYISGQKIVRGTYCKYVAKGCVNRGYVRRRTAVACVGWVINLSWCP